MCGGPISPRRYFSRDQSGGCELKYCGRPHSSQPVGLPVIQETCGKARNASLTSQSAPGWYLSSELSQAMMAPPERRNPSLTAGYCPPSGALCQWLRCFWCFRMISGDPSELPPSMTMYSSPG